MSSPIISPDLLDFLSRMPRRQGSSAQEKLARVGQHLVDGAVRIRRGQNGVYGHVERPVTKPAEAIGAWIRDLDESSSELGGIPRTHETREAVAAAAEELDQATHMLPTASRLRSAIYADALGALGADTAGAPVSSFWPALASGLAGILVGIFIGRQLA